ncbi:MAG: F0F1 ATP synthase subunit B [Bacilli bacterium]|jgi:F-type H+-transporting ATPase subunit b
MNLFNHLMFLTDGPFTPDDFRDKMFPDGIWGFVTQILVLIVMIIIIFFLLYKPVKKMLDQRAAHVEENIKQAEITRQEMNEKLADADRKVAEEREKAQLMIKETLEQSEKARQEMIKEAKAEAAKEKAIALEEIEMAKREALDEIHEEIVEVALDASKKVLEREINEADNQKLIEDFIKDVDKR